ncbi:MAG TPA: hypothetical protein VFA51_07220 [Candidatus Udaeobacter sp.]|nr:hypothetical protein [Candidatus Udaeobacter sp.]
MRESDLYKPVAQFLERRYGIAHKNTWTAGSGRDLAFFAGFGRRKPDVVACKPHPLKPEVHLAEGKLLNIPTHGFEETVNQLDSFRSYGDFLWAVFPWGSWSSATTNHDRWISQLQGRGYGLILVGDGRAKPQFDALPNSSVDHTKRKSLLTALLGASDDPIFLPSLSTETAETAIRAACRVAAIMSGPVRDVVGKNRKESTFSAPFVTDQPVFALGDVEIGQNSYIQGDPFGTYLKDGRALIWVWRDWGTLRNDEKSIRTFTSRLPPSDVYFYAENDKSEFICRPLSELSLDGLKETRYLGWFSLGRAIPVSDRSLAGIKSDVRRLIQWVRER